MKRWIGITCRNVELEIWARYEPGYWELVIQHYDLVMHVTYMSCMLYTLGYVWWTEIFIMIPWKNLKNQIINFIWSEKKEPWGYLVLDMKGCQHIWTYLHQYKPPKTFITTLKNIYDRRSHKSESICNGLWCQNQALSDDTFSILRSYQSHWFPRYQSHWFPRYQSHWFPRYQSHWFPRYQSHWFPRYQSHWFPRYQSHWFPRYQSHWFPRLTLTKALLMWLSCRFFLMAGELP